MEIRPPSKTRMASIKPSLSFPRRASLGTERVVGGHDDADGAIHARKLFYGDHVFYVAQAGPAIFWGEYDAHHAHLAQLLDDFQGKLRSLVPFHYMRGDFALRKFAQRFF